MFCQVYVKMVRNGCLNAGYYLFIIHDEIRTFQCLTDLNIILTKLASLQVIFGFDLLNKKLKFSENNSLIQTQSYS